jgi:S-adenosylmethionine hydrolase
MPVITLTTDWGLTDHYVAALKGELMSLAPEAAIVDITHQIPAYDFMRAAFVFKSAYYFFPPQTIHLVAVGKQALREQPSGWMIIEDRESMIICRNNGFFTLVAGRLPEKAVYITESEKVSIADEKSFLVTIILDLLQRLPIEKLGKPVDSMVQANFFLPSSDDTMINGAIIHVDTYGNAITNIERDFFYQSVGSKRFELDLPRRDVVINQISNRYDDVKPGQILALFNSTGFLEIAQNQGDVSRLYGLEYGDKIRIALL